MRFAWWMAPVIGVGACAIANGALIATALRVRPQKVVDRPYAASAFEDQRAAERTDFTARGWGLTAAVAGDGCILTLTSPGDRPALAGIVHLYRPDDRSADRDMTWGDPATPLSCPLPRPGVWGLRVELRDRDGAVLSRDLRLNRP